MTIPFLFSENSLILMMMKTRVAVLFGGRSGEHEVSLVSAASVVRHLDRSRFDVLLVAVDKAGRWHLGDLAAIDPQSQALPVFSDGPAVVLPPYPVGLGKEPVLLFLDDPASDPVGRPSGSFAKGGSGSSRVAAAFDVVFPVMHGTNCEDGTLQGLLELAGVPYVGCAVLASAVGMDKEVAKRLAREAGWPIVPFFSVHLARWKNEFLKMRQSVLERVQGELGFPVFVKPANSGSSVGVHKVKDASALEAALEDAFRYDEKVLIEKAIAAREIELAVLENKDPSQLPRVSIAGEVLPTHEFYSYEAKYLDDHGAQLCLPAELSAEQQRTAQELAQNLFLTLGCEGMARVDLFLDKNSGVFYFNEVNTLPGFTQISMYPKLWEQSGLSYSELLTELIELALLRHQRRSKLLREYSPSPS